MKWAIESLQKAGEYAEDKKIVLTVEPINRYEVGLVNSINGGLEMAKKVNNPFVRIMGGWPDDIKNIFSNMYQFIREEKDVFKDKSSFPTFVDSHNIMLLVEAALKSNREQRWIEIEEN